MQIFIYNTADYNMVYVKVLVWNVWIYEILPNTAIQTF